MSRGRQPDPFEVKRRRIRLQFRIIMMINIIMFFAALGSVVWLATHPETIGSFFGRIADGFSGRGAA